MNALAPVVPRLGKLLRLLASDRDGEVLAAARGIVRTLQAAGADIHALTNVIETSADRKFSEADAHEIYQRGREEGRREAEAHATTFYDPDWMRIAEECADSLRLTPREHDFVQSMLEWISDGSEPTEKQAAWLKSIHRRVRP